jgi:hypothetical protein
MQRPHHHVSSVGRNCAQGEPSYRTRSPESKPCQASRPSPFTFWHDGSPGEGGSEIPTDRFGTGTEEAQVICDADKILRQRPTAPEGTNGLSDCIASKVVSDTKLNADLAQLRASSGRY